MESLPSTIVDSGSSAMQRAQMVTRMPRRPSRISGAGEEGGDDLRHDSNRRATTPEDRCIVAQRVMSWRGVVMTDRAPDWAAAGVRRRRECGGVRPRTGCELVRVRAKPASPELLYGTGEGRVMERGPAAPKPSTVRPTGLAKPLSIALGEAS